MNLEAFETFACKSVLEQRFIEALSDPRLKVISFDIFDTLLLRQCSSHHDVYLQTGEDALVSDFFDTPFAFAQYRLNASKRAREKHKEVEEITFDMIYKQLPLQEDQCKIFQAIELSCEEKVIIPNPQTNRWIRMAHDAGKKIILISDMYLSAQQIDQIGLKKLTCKEFITKIYISSECNARKATGTLFLHVKEDLNLKADELLHIGDHLRSDVKIPQSLGIKTIHYGLDTATQNALHHENVFLKESLHKGAHVRLLTALLNPFKDEMERFYFTMGALFFAPALWEFSHWLAKISSHHKIDKLHFLMREGAIFETVFKALYPAIPTSRLYISRQSTFLPLLKKGALDQLNFHLYKAFRIEDFYHTYLLEITDPLIQEHHYLLCSEASEYLLEKETLLDYVMRDLENRKEEILNNATMQKGLLADYLKELTQNSALIDFGGGGTVLKRLYEILPSEVHPKLGILFYQHAQGYKNLIPHHVLSFLPYHAKTATLLTHIARSCDVLEILLNGTQKTTKAYAAKEGMTTPLTYLPTCNQESIAPLSSAFHQGIEAFLSVTQEVKLPANTFDPTWLAAMLARIITLPTFQEATRLGALEYDEGKGSLHHYQLIDNAKCDALKVQGIDATYKQFLAHPAASKNKFPWLQGLITTLDPEYLLSLYGGTSNPNQHIIVELLKQLDALHVNEIMVYGAGELFTQLLPHLNERNISIQALIDSRASTVAFEAEGYRVISLEHAMANVSSVTIVIASGVFAHNISLSIKKFAHEHTKNMTIISV